MAAEEMSFVEIEKGKTTFKVIDQELARPAGAGDAGGAPTADPS